MPWDVNARLADAVDVNSSANGTAVDVGGVAGAVQGVVEFRMWVKAITGTSPTLDMYIDESDDNSTWREVCHFRQVSGTKTTTTQYQQVGVVRQRYLRYRTVVGGTTPVFNDVTIYARGTGVHVPDLPAAT